jgi:BirA family biotin operon repressor/biotin-[acetyl-CoA-carboxylase] ligase
LLANKPNRQTLGNPLVVLNSVDSTNNYAMQQARTGLAQNGSAYLALEQTAGKGQRGRNWQASKGDNLLLSTVLAPEQQGLKSPVELSITVALACYDLVKIYLGEEDCSIKWPNDLYWQDRKAGGILIESIWTAGALDPSMHETQGIWTWAIVGTGLNLNQREFPGLGKQAVSFLQVTGKKNDPLQACKQLLALLEIRLEELRELGFEALLDAYNEALYLKNKEVELMLNGGILKTTIQSVDGKGRLVTADGVFEWGAVQFKKREP